MNLIKINISGSSTLPRTQSKSENGTDVSGSNTLPSRDKVTTGTSSGSLYDTVGSDKSKSTGSIKQMKDRETATPGGKISSHITANAQTPHATTSTSTSTSQTDDVRFRKYSTPVSPTFNPIPVVIRLFAGRRHVQE